MHSMISRRLFLFVIICLTIVVLNWWEYPDFLLSSDSRNEDKDIPKTVLIFTAWKSARNIERFRKRIMHHKDYADRYGYKYAVYVTGNDTSIDKNIDVIHSNNWVKDHSPGWLKVFAFQQFFDTYPDIDYFFYIDMDVLFYNFALPVTDVLKGKQQSIFLSTSLPDLSSDGRSVLTPSHSLIIKNNIVSREFVRLWLTSWNQYPSINMEQGALYATTAMWYDKTGNKSATGFSCLFYDGQPRKMHVFGECCVDYMNTNHKNWKTKLFPNPDILIFKFFSEQHIPPRDGFSAFPYGIDMNTSCPLVIHPYKNFDTIEVTPNYNNCMKS
jgi:hypothetical protein